MDNNEFSERLDRLLGGDKQHGFDTDFARFCADLAAAKPEPDETFTRELQNRLQPKRNISMRFNGFKTRAAAAVSLLLIVATVVYAVDAFLQQRINMDFGLRGANEAELGTPLNLSQTIDNVTVTLQWVYADQNRITVAYTMDGEGLLESPAFSYYGKSARLSDAEERVYESAGGHGSIGMGEAGFGVQSFDASKFAPLPDELHLRFELTLWIMTEDGYATLRAVLTPEANVVKNWNPDEFVLSDPIGPFQFEFTAFTRTGKVITVGQTVTDQAVTITLERAVISPSQTRLIICFDQSHQQTERWAVAPHLRINGVDVLETQLTSGIGEDVLQETNCHALIYNAAFGNHYGTWELEITEIIIFGDSGADQTRIAGSWQFTFEHLS